MKRFMPLTVIGLLLAPFAYAVSYNAGTSGDWTTNTTWTPNIDGGPLAADTIDLNLTSPATWSADLAGADRTITSLSFTGTGQATFTGSNTLFITSNAATALNKNGTGRLTFNNAVTVTGTAALNTGTVSGSGTITAAAYTNSGTATVSANLAGTGATLTAGGTTGVTTLTLSGNNTYTGGTTVGGSDILRINSTNAIGTGNLTLSGGAIIDNTSGTALTLATTNNITNTSQFTFAGTNDLNFGAGRFLLAANTRTLNFAGVGSTLTFGGITASADGASRGFTLSNLTGASGNTLVIGNLVMAPVGSTTTVNTTTLTTNGDTTLKITGVVSNGNAAANRLTKSGTGTLILEGTNTYTGATTISAGTLFVNGSLHASSAVALNAATLGGNGTINGAVTTAGATSTFTPGSTAAGTGTLTVGALNAASGATFNFGLGTSSDRIAVTGAFTGSTNAGGLTFNFDNSGGLAANTVYTLLTFGSNSGFALSDLTTGSIASTFALDTSFGTGGYLINSNDLQVRFISTVIPEPSTWALLAGVACLLTAACSRRRSHRA